MSKSTPEAKISVVDAIRVRDALRDILAGISAGKFFKCPSCGGGMRPQGGQNERFEHVGNNPHCSGVVPER
jgi:hypothetical protein